MHTHFSRPDFFWLLGILYVATLSQVFYSARDSMLTLRQMFRKGISTGLPLIWHFGIWGDGVYLSFVLAFIAGLYGNQWHGWMSVSIGFGASLLVHVFVYTKIKFPEAHAHDGKLTDAGWTHLCYMAIAFAIFISFFFQTSNIAPWIVYTTAIILPIHLMIGNHMLLGLLKQLGIIEASWYGGKPLTDKGGWGSVIVVTALIAWRTYHIVHTPGGLAS